METVNTIIAKRDGKELSSEQISAFVQGTTDGTIPDYQVSALLMAIVLKGMTIAETAQLTDAMAFSGATLNWHGTAHTIDKHSTGGVGDKTSLIVVPLLAACGAIVCKMSGRGLGHTGGTLDKLESIPGFRTALTRDEIKDQCSRIGAVLAGQSKELAPADGILYALRDVTGTVESIPLLVSSIVSKKIAGGAANLIFDVKVGDGAFMNTVEGASLLANTLLLVSQSFGKRAVVVLTDMDQPLGRTAGNALELREVIDALNPDSMDSMDTRLYSVCLTLASQSLMLTHAIDQKEAEMRIGHAWKSGAAFIAFQALVKAQHGAESVINHPNTLPTAPVERVVTSKESGYIARISAKAVGDIVVGLGGGRRIKTDLINHAVGIETCVHVGSWVTAGQVIFRIHAMDSPDASVAENNLYKSIAIVAERPSVPDVVHEIRVA